MNDDVKNPDGATDAAADAQPADTGESFAAPDAPRTFQALKKLNPGLDPFIFFGL